MPVPSEDFAEALMTAILDGIKAIVEKEQTRPEGSDSDKEVEK